MTLNGARHLFHTARGYGFRLHLRRLVDAPRIEVDPTDSTSYRLSGVVCGVCAARTESALASAPGVEAAAVDLEGSRATLRLSPGARVDVPALQRALDGVVVGASMRRWIERTVRRIVPGAAPHGSGAAGRNT